MPGCDRTTVDLMRALHFAAQRHRQQRRKGVDADPYINHAVDVALLIAEATQGKDGAVVVAALLHDTVEDTGATREELQTLFGEHVAGVVAEVSDDAGLPRHERKRLQIERAPLLSHGAKLIKIADKLSNVRSIVADPPLHWNRTRRREYVLWARQVVEGCRGVSEWLELQFEDACRTCLEQLAE